MKLISFFGPQGAGKSECAKAVAALPGWHRISFADPLYAMMSVLLGTDARSLPKHEPQDALCGKTLRFALQRLGTEFGRNMLGETIWIDALARRVAELCDAGAAGVVIDDLRFANEYALLRSLGAHIVCVSREGHTMKADHASEADWVDFTPDGGIWNNGSVEELRDHAVNFARI